MIAAIDHNSVFRIVTVQRPSVGGESFLPILQTHPNPNAVDAIFCLGILVQRNETDEQRIVHRGVDIYSKLNAIVTVFCFPAANFTLVNES